MNKRPCINLPGLLGYESIRMGEETHHDRQKEIEFVERNSPRERWEYCTFRCPVQQRCKFNARYGTEQVKEAEDLGWDASINIGRFK